MIHPGNRTAKAKENMRGVMHAGERREGDEAPAKRVSAPSGDATRNRRR